MFKDSSESEVRGTCLTASGGSGKSRKIYSRRVIIYLRWAASNKCMYGKHCIYYWKINNLHLQTFLSILRLQVEAETPLINKI